MTPLILTRLPASVPGPSPRLDVLELARRLAAELPATSRTPPPLRRLEACLRLDLGVACIGARRAARASAVLSTSERVAIPLAALLAVAGRRVPHIVIAHKLSSAAKRRLFRVWALQRRFSEVVCVCAAQAAYATAALGLPAARVHQIAHAVDERFFRPCEHSDEGYVLAVGREARDYGTLVRAVAGTGLRTVIVSSSRWSAGGVQLPAAAEVEVVSGLSFERLRALYAGARVVAVPLLAVDYAAGVNAVLEAMAMGKPVVVARTPGIADYLADGETSVTIPVGDAARWRDALRALWDQPAERARLGANARCAVEAAWTLDHYVERVAGIVERAAGAA